MPYMRTWRWKVAAVALFEVDPNLRWVVEVLGDLDQELYELDQTHKELLRKGPDPTLSDFLGVGPATANSYFWVLGAYEAIRTIHQRFTQMGSNATNRQRAAAAVKHQFERVRVPLAKLEPARRHDSTDYSFPRPGIEDGRGIAWEVAPGVALSRSQLSDEFLAFLEGLKFGTISG